MKRKSKIDLIAETRNQHMVPPTATEVSSATAETMRRIYAAVWDEGNRASRRAINPYRAALDGAAADPAAATEGNER